MGFNTLTRCLLLTSLTCLMTSAVYFEDGYDHHYTYSSESDVLGMHNVTTVIKVSTYKGCFNWRLWWRHWRLRWLRRSIYSYVLQCVTLFRSLRLTLSVQLFMSIYHLQLLFLFVLLIVLLSLLLPSSRSYFYRRFTVYSVSSSFFLFLSVFFSYYY